MQMKLKMNPEVTLVCTLQYDAMHCELSENFQLELTYIKLTKQLLQTVSNLTPLELR